MRRAIRRRGQGGKQPPPVWLGRNVTIQGWRGARGPAAPVRLDLNFTDALQLVVGHGVTLTMRDLVLANIRRRHRMGWDAIEGKGGWLGVRWVFVTTCVCVCVCVCG